VPVRLRRAILQNDVLLVKRIVKNNRRSLENPDFADKSNTSLHLAAVKGHVDIVVSFPLPLYCQSGTKKILIWLESKKLLISFGHDSCEPLIDPTGYDAAPGIALNTDGSTPLHLAAAHSHARCVQVLCESFPHITNARNYEGKTALMLAAQGSNPGHAPVVLNTVHMAGTTATPATTTGTTAGTTRPRAVSSEEDTATITTLLDHGAAVGVTDLAGNTALHHASAWGNLKAVRILLAAGAPPFVRNRANHTPFEYSITKQAAQYFQSIIVEFGKQQQGQGQGQDSSSGGGGGLQLNTAAAAAASAAAPADEPWSATSVQSLKSKSPFAKGMSPSKGGLRLVIDTENNELADIEDDDVPFTARKVSIEEQRLKS
jgi:ankyrin repeat protein